MVIKNYLDHDNDIDKGRTQYNDIARFTKYSRVMILSRVTL